MLGIGNYTIILKAFHIGHCSLSYCFFVFSKCPKANDWIFRVRVDIHYWSEINVHAQFFELSGHFGSHIINQIWILNSAQSHGSRKIRNWVQSHANPPFCIHCDEKGCFSQGLIVIGQTSLSVRSSLKKYQSSKILVFYKLTDFINVLLIFIGISGNHKKLPQALLWT